MAKRMRIGSVLVRIVAAEYMAQLFEARTHTRLPGSYFFPHLGNKVCIRHSLLRFVFPAHVRKVILRGRKGFVPKLLHDARIPENRFERVKARCCSASSASNRRHKYLR